MGMGSLAETPYASGGQWVDRKDRDGIVERICGKELGILGCLPRDWVPRKRRWSQKRRS